MEVSSAIGRYKKGSESSLLGLAMEMILGNFHIWVIVFVLTAVLRRLVRCLMAMSPRYLRYLMLRLSDSVKLLFLECFTACIVSAAMIIIGVDVSDLVCLFIILYVGLKECVMVDLKYLFSVLAFFMSVLVVLLL